MRSPRSWVIARREVGAAFETPTGWAVVAVLPALAAAFFLVLGPFFALGEAGMRGFFGTLPWLLALVAPALSMRAWAEERRSGTEELLLTWPLRLRELVWGKFLGAWIVLALALAATLAVPATVATLGDLDLGPVAGGYLGALAFGGAALAVGLLCSACTRSQAVAWLAAVALLTAMSLIGRAATAAAVPPELGRLLLSLDLQERFHALARGMADFGALAHYGGLIALGLCGSGLALEARAGSRAVPWSATGAQAALLLALVVALVALAGRARWRADLTEEGLYSLDPATRGLLARLQDRLQVKFYFNRDIAGAEALLPQRLRIQDFLAEFEAAGAPWVRVETVDPTADLIAQRDAEHVGIQPLQVETGGLAEAGVALAYQGIELRHQDRSEVIPFAVPAELEFAIAARLSSLLRPRRPAIAFFSREPRLGPPVPGMPRRIPAGRDFHELRAILSARCSVRDVELSDPAWRDEDVAGLVVARPEDVTSVEAAALDRYLVEGGRVLLLADVEIVDQSNFERRTLASGLEGWLAAAGLRVAPGLVWDDACMILEAGSEEIETQAGRRRVPLRVSYGFFPDLAGDGLAAGHAVTGALGGVTLLWAHPVELRQPAAGLSAETLLRSSAQSWVVPPDTPILLEREVLQRLSRFVRQGGPGQPQALAVALHGGFTPQFPHEGLTPAPGLLVVVGDADLFVNGVLNHPAVGGENAAFAANLADWLTGDESLIGLRSRGRSDRRLRDLRAEYVAAQGGWAETDAENREIDRAAQAHARARQRLLSWGNVLGPPALVLLLAWLARWRRRARGGRASAAQEARP